MVLRTTAFLLATALGAAPTPAPPAAPAVQRAPQSAPSIAFEKYTLPNGMEVILHEDRRIPVVAVNVWYHVGAVNERPGRTGFAHLFEHMMFQGSKNVGDDQHLQLVQHLGGSDVNGTTNFDRTNYFQSVPSHHLETALWLESDRMGFLLDALNEKKLATQRDVVMNERRQSIETAPYGLAEEKLFQALFPAPHPYYGMIIGSMADLAAASVEDVRQFFRTYYAPSNATLAVAGSFDKARAKALIEKYFGTLPSASKPPGPQVTPARLTAEVALSHAETVATLPLVQLAWHSPALFAPGDAEADILAMILSHGEASRLQRRLVREKQLAQSVEASQQSMGVQSVFAVQGIARPGVDPKQLQRELDAVLEEVRGKGVTAEEITRARNRIETDLVARLQTVGGFGGKADRLQAYNHYLGRPDYLAEDLARYQRVTPESVQRFANEVLKPNLRVVLVAVPQRSDEQAMKGVQP